MPWHLHWHWRSAASVHVFSSCLAGAPQGVLLDASCGSGLFTRRFAASGAYSAVVAADFSEAMLLQARRLAAFVAAAFPNMRRPRNNGRPAPH